MTLDDVNELVPEHDRTSCSDDNSNGNEYPRPSTGYVRCVRCAFLYRVRNGHWPYEGRPYLGSLQILGNRE